MIAITLALAAAVPAAAVPPPPPPPPRAAPAGPPRGPAALKARGMSDAGIAVVRQNGTPDPDARAVLGRRQALRDRMAAASAATPFDIDGFAALVKEASQMEASARARNEERIVTTLKALPAADRPIYAKAVSGVLLPPPPPPAPPRPAPPPRPVS